MGHNGDTGVNPVNGNDTGYWNVHTPSQHYKNKGQMKAFIDTFWPTILEYFNIFDHIYNTLKIYSKVLNGSKVLFKICEKNIMSWLL